MKTYIIILLIILLFLLYQNKDNFFSISTEEVADEAILDEDVLDVDQVKSKLVVVIFDWVTGEVNNIPPDAIISALSLARI